jgi:hypothetical protein
VSEQLLNILKLCLLASLYLFFFRVLRAVWAQLRTPVPAPAPAAAGGRRSRGPEVPVAAAAATAAPKGRRGSKRNPTQLVVMAPPERAGTTYPIGQELTVGRAGGCAVALPEDTFVSSLHARVYRTDQGVAVEDLGSTNGTFVNQDRVTSPVPINRGDRVKVGSTVLEAR